MTKDPSEIHVPQRGPAWWDDSPPRPGPLYSLGKWVLGPILTALFRMRFVGVDRVPASGRLILAGNHVSYMDPLVMVAATERRRPIHFMAKIELFRVRAFGWVLRQIHAFPVHRGRTDRETIRTAIAILQREGVVGIFPEGTRVRGAKTSEGQEGAAFLALHTGASIIPVGICGTDRIQPPGQRLWHLVPLTAYFGEPIDPATFEGERKARLEALTAAVMAGIEEAKRQADCVGRR